jgi:putative toxin-antitoxin system antitoxin component (TIGR02293 family)
MATGRITTERKLNREITSLLRRPGAGNFRFSKRTNFTFEDFLSDKMLMIEAIRAGIPYSLFDLIKHYTPFSEEDWANILDISAKSLQRYKSAPNHYFRSLQSQKIIEMAEVTKAGLDVFGDMDKLKLWLNTPNFSLGRLKPIDLLKDSYGKEMVIGELTRTNHGILV